MKGFKNSRKFCIFIFSKNFLKLCGIYKSLSENSGEKMKLSQNYNLTTILYDVPFKAPNTSGDASYRYTDTC